MSNPRNKEIVTAEVQFGEYSNVIRVVNHNLIGFKCHSIDI